MFTISLVTVAIMLLYAVPGFLLVKSKLVKENAISAFAVFLMYVCQPCLTIYTFQKAEFTWALVGNIGIIFGLALLIMGAMLFGMFFIMKKKYSDVRYRIANVAGAFGNCTFMGVPLLEALLPNNPEAALYSTIFFIAMSILGWTVASALITQDKKYIKPMKIVLNPAVLALIVALPLFFAKVTLPTVLNDAITLVGKMSTPLCMVIMGMRLATVKVKSIFVEPTVYVATAVKLVIMPLIGLLLTWFLPIDYALKVSFYVMCCCPVAAVVLTFAEMLNEGQKSAANVVLLSTIFSLATLPLMMLIIQNI